jgi:hypothetical protein
MTLRIEFKTDEESSIGRGAVIYRQHFLPIMLPLFEGMARATEEKLPAARTLRVTEGWRPQRTPGKRDLHTEMKALDFTIEFIRGIRATLEEYRRVAEHCRGIVGDADYDFFVHGEGSNLHIHAEYDPKPQKGVA